MSDAFTRPKFEWLNQVTADGKLSFAMRVAIRLVQYLNRSTLEASPSQAR